MKESHLTVRLSDDLAAALERAADERGVPKSMIARAAVAEYLTSAPAAKSVERPILLARDLAARWGSLPRLSPDDAMSFEDDLRAARRDIGPPDDRSWG